MPHFLLQSLSSGSIVEAPDVDEPWCEGLSLEYEMKTPLRFVVDAAGLQRGSFYDGIVPLWSDRLFAAVTAAGVDNIEAYPAIVDFTTGAAEAAYWAVNIVGLVEAVDWEASNLNAGAYARGDLDPSVFVLAQATANAFRLFRLAESPDLIVVDERVRLCVEASGITDVQFVVPGLRE